MAGQKKIVASFNIETEEGKRNLEALEKAILKMGDAGVKAAPRVTQSVQSIDAEFRKLDKKINETGNVTQRDIDKIARLLAGLAEDTTDSFGSAAKAPKALQDAIGGYEQRLASATERTGKLNDAVKDNAAQAQVAAGNWPGLGNAIESVGGKTGKVVAGFGLVTAAFNQGWEIGQKLNKFFGTDMSLWEEFIGKFGAYAGAVIRGLSDVLVSFYQLQVDLLSLNIGEAKKSFASLKENVTSFYDKVVEGGERSLESAKKQNNAAKELLEAQLKARLALNDLVAAQHAGTITSAMFSDALLKLLPSLDETAKKTHAAAIEEANRQVVVKEAIAQIDAFIQALKKEQLERQLGVDKMRGEIDQWALYKKGLEEAQRSVEAGKAAKGGLTEQMALELGKILELLPAWEKHRGELDAFNQILNSQVEIHKNGLTPAQEKELKAITAAIGKYGELDPVERELIKRKIELALQTDKVADRTGANSTIVETSKGHYENLSGAVDAGTVKMGSYATELQRVNGLLIEIAKNGRPAADALNAVNDAADRGASGGDGGGDAKPTDKPGWKTGTVSQ